MRYGYYDSVVKLFFLLSLKTIFSGFVCVSVWHNVVNREETIVKVVMSSSLQVIYSTILLIKYDGCMSQSKCHSKYRHHPKETGANHFKTQAT